MGQASHPQRAAKHAIEAEMVSLVSPIPMNPINDPDVKPADLPLIPKPLRVSASNAESESRDSSTTTLGMVIDDKDHPFCEPHLLLQDIQRITDEIDKAILDYVNLGGSKRALGALTVESPYIVSFRSQSPSSRANESGVQAVAAYEVRSPRYRNAIDFTRRRDRPSSVLSSNDERIDESSRHTTVENERKVLEWLGSKNVHHAKEWDSTNRAFSSTQSPRDGKPSREDSLNLREMEFPSRVELRARERRKVSGNGSGTELDIKEPANRADVHRGRSGGKHRRSSLRKEVLGRDAGHLIAMDGRQSTDSTNATNKSRRSSSSKHRQEEREPVRLSKASSTRSSTRSPELEQKSYRNWFFR